MRTEFSFFIRSGERTCLQSPYKTLGPENALVPSCYSESELRKSQSHSALYILQGRYAKNIKHLVKKTYIIFMSNCRTIHTNIYSSNYNYRKELNLQQLIAFAKL